MLPLETEEALSPIKQKYKKEEYELFSRISLRTVNQSESLEDELKNTQRMLQLR